MGELADIVYETIQEFPDIENDVLDALEGDYEAQGIVFHERIPQMQAAIASAAIVIDGLTKLFMEDDLT